MSNSVKTYDRFLQSAAKNFALHGYDGTTTRTIVKDAGSSLSYLQDNFKSKENLYRIVVFKAMEFQYDTIKTLYEEIDLAEKGGNLDSVLAWKFIGRMVDKLIEWVTLDDVKYSILLINHIMLGNDPIFTEIPDKAMLVHKYLEKLFLAYLHLSDSTLIKLLSFNTVITIFSLSTYPRVLKETLDVENIDFDLPQNIRTKMKEIILNNIRSQNVNVHK